MLPDRIVCRHTDGDVVIFNQVIMEQEEEPLEYVKLVAIGETGLHIFRVKRTVAQPHTKAQHKGYSRSLSVNLFEPQEFLGPKQFISRLSFTVEAWDRLKKARTNRLSKLVRDVLA